MTAAGRLLEGLPELWERSNLGERRMILMTMLEAVYVECKEERRIVAIKPKPAFRPLFEIAMMREGSGVVLVRDDDDQDDSLGNGAKPKTGPSGPDCGDGSASDNDARESNQCWWWRRGRVELPVQKTLRLGCTTSLSGN